MTDARLPGRWLIDPRFDQLSDKAWRVYTNALMYSAEAGTDGALERRALRFLHPDGFDPAIGQELVAAGLWEPATDGFQSTGWDEAQARASSVEDRRRQNRDNQQKARERRKATQAARVSNDVSSDVSADRQGQDRTVDRTGQDENQPRREVSAAAELPVLEPAPAGPGQRFPYGAWDR